MGGAQTHLATMMEHAKTAHPELRHEVLSLFGEGLIGERLRSQGFAVTALDLTQAVRSHHYPRAIRQLQAAIAATRPTVVEAHLTWSRLLALTAASRMKVPVRVGYEHGDLFMKSARIRAANFLLQRSAQRIVVVSNALKRWFSRTHHVGWDRLVVMHNGIDTERFVQRAAAARQRPPIPDLEFEPGSVVFAAVGTLGSGVNKRVDVCIDAVLTCRARSVPASLLVCGDGPQRPQLEARVRASSCPNAVRFLGQRSDVAEILGKCDAFCHGAPFEPFGIVCVEAMASQLPVLVPDGGGIHEAMTDGSSGFVYRSLDAADLADKMTRLVNDPELRKRMGAAAQVEAQKRFDIADYMVRLVGMYRTLAATNVGAS